MSESALSRGLTERNVLPERTSIGVLSDENCELIASASLSQLAVCSRVGLTPAGVCTKILGSVNPWLAWVVLGSLWPPKFDSHFSFFVYSVACFFLSLTSDAYGWMNASIVLRWMAAGYPIVFSYCIALVSPSLEAVDSLLFLHLYTDRPDSHDEAGSGFTYE